MQLSRLLTGPSDIPDSELVQRVEYALNNGWNLHGSPSAVFNSKDKTLIVGQSITGEQKGEYSSFISLKEMKPLKGGHKTPLYYRLLVGLDDSRFCAYVESKLNEGWDLYGSPALAFNGERVIAVQAITRKMKGRYKGFVPLSEISPVQRKDLSKKSRIKRLAPGG